MIPSESNETNPQAPHQATEHAPAQTAFEKSRRIFLFKLSVALNAVVGAVVAVPVLGYVLAPALKKKNADNTWISVGKLSDFPEGETRLVNYRNPSTTPWDGETADIPAWVRRIEGNKFQVFAINCAHLGCPVRWFSQSKLFLCPCHGGAYYEDGSRASGPPERGLFEYEYKVQGDHLIISAGQMPTLAAKSGCTSDKGLTQIGGLAGGIASTTENKAENGGCSSCQA